MSIRFSDPKWAACIARTRKLVIGWLFAKHVPCNGVNGVDRSPRNTPPTKEPGDTRSLVGLLGRTFSAEHTLASAAICRKQEADYLPIDHISWLDRDLAANTATYQLNSRVAGFTGLVVQHISVRIVLRSRFRVTEDLVSLIQALEIARRVC
jgi:hypothetical protein